MAHRVMPDIVILKQYVAGLTLEAHARPSSLTVDNVLRVLEGAK